MLPTTRTVYPFELKLAAVTAHIDDRASTEAVLAEYSIRSVTSLEEWCRRFRAGGEDTLRPKRRGIPPTVSKSPEDETLEERCTRLEMEK